MNSKKKNIVFLCVANSARSQMAEAIARQLAPAHVTVFSAGSIPSRVHPLAKLALDEANYSHEGQFSKGFADIPLSEMDHVIPLCKEEQCPVFPGAMERHHWPLPDPAAAGLPHELDGFRRVRDTLTTKIGHFIQNGL